MARPSYASLQLPSDKVSQSPLDFPNSLVCILEDAVSKGCKIADITEGSVPNKNEIVSLDSTFIN
jgi:hypothetical protein